MTVPIFSGESVQEPNKNPETPDDTGQLQVISELFVKLFTQVSEVSGKNTIQSASVKNTISTSISPYLFNPSDKTERTLSNDIKRLCHKTLLADNGWKTIPGVGEILDMTNATHIKLKYEKVYFTGNGSGTQTFTVSR